MSPSSCRLLCTDSAGTDHRELTAPQQAFDSMRADFHAIDDDFCTLQPIRVWRIGSRDTVDVHQQFAAQHKVFALHSGSGDLAHATNIQNALIRETASAVTNAHRAFGTR